MVSPREGQEIEEIPAGEAELVSVAADVRALEPAQQNLPVVQVAAVAATGFAVGAVTVAAMQRRRTVKPRLLRRKRKGKRGSDLLSVASSRSFLVDIHLLNRE